MATNICHSPPIRCLGNILCTWRSHNAVGCTYATVEVLFLNLEVAAFLFTLSLMLCR